MQIVLPLLALLLGTATATPPTYTYAVEIDQNKLNHLQFTEDLQNITAVADALQSKYKNNPSIRNRTIFALSLTATLQPTSSTCHPSAYENLFVPLNYISRTAPLYLPDAEEITGDFISHPLVYPMAAYLGEVYNTNHIIDIGCGCGRRAAELAWYGFTVTAIDVGPNIHCAKNRYRHSSFYQDRIEFIAMELGAGGNEHEYEHGTTPPLYRLLSRNVESPAIIVASNIIEHLVDPFVLLSLIKRLLNSGAHAAVLSTPERDLMYGGIHTGPPFHDCHMREWNLHEFQSMLRCSPGLQLIASGLTLSNDVSHSVAATTIAVVTPEHRGTASKKAKSKTEAKNLCGDIDLTRANRYGTFVCHLEMTETNEMNVTKEVEEVEAMETMETMETMEKTKAMAWAEHSDCTVALPSLPDGTKHPRVKHVVHLTIAHETHRLAPRAVELIPPHHCAPAFVPFWVQFLQLRWPNNGVT